MSKKYGLGEHDEVPEKLIPSTFSDENVFLESDDMVILKRHYTNCYLKLPKELLNYLEDLMTQDFTVGTKSKKNGSDVSKMSTPSAKSGDTKAPKAFEFYPTHLNDAFTPTPDFEGYRRNAKEQYENATNQLEGSPEFLNEDLHHMPDYPNTFMNSI
jgi:hypothetical protein